MFCQAMIIYYNKRMTLSDWCLANGFQLLLEKRKGIFTDENR